MSSLLPRLFVSLSFAFVRPTVRLPSIAYADAGVDPLYFPEAPTVALPIALKKAGLTKDDIAAWEINEAYSVVVRIVEKVMGVDPAKINVNG